ncbi:hypothetical protein COO60DRAFT_1094036 [Scenedesmus sp. NREL 46B-D3]|nr:hypothetical protein COO60DRAFT_1094036 [Scenedesmus sp. NREL 46B-D3]
MRVCCSSHPSACSAALPALPAAGHEVLLVGGAVRDLLLQRGEPKDFDILTSAQLKQVKALFRSPRIIGRNFPICQLEASGLKLEISSMHTRPPRAWQPSPTAAAAAGGPAAVPADVAEHCLGAGAAVGSTSSHVSPCVVLCCVVLCCVVLCCVVLCCVVLCCVVLCCVVLCCVLHLTCAFVAWLPADCLCKSTHLASCWPSGRRSRHAHPALYCLATPRRRPAT